MVDVEVEEIVKMPPIKKTKIIISVPKFEKEKKIVTIDMSTPYPTVTFKGDNWTGSDIKLCMSALKIGYKSELRELYRKEYIKNE